MPISAEPSSQAGGLRRLGDFVLLEEIGRGGMGMVYRARQVSMDRQVALKVLPSFAGLDSESVARFQREAEAAGRLSHPGIVPIYAVGSVEGIHFFAMELVEGPSLFQLLESLRGAPPESFRGTLMEETAMATVFPDSQGGAIPPFLSASRYAASCAGLIMEIAGALTIAHQGKVIHRDLKPSNILIHPAGRPVLVDFGLARDELAFSMTQTGDAVGTPAYMAPEQAAGLRDVDARVDVYGLGATLYEMLTLRPPFDGAHSAEIMQAILDEDPIPPRKLNPRVPRALDTIVLACLAKDPDRRYATANELQSDLRAMLAGGSIRARRPGLCEIVARRVRRNRRSAYVAILSTMFALLVGLMVGLAVVNQTRQEGRSALENARAALLAGRPRQAHAAYVEALVLLENAPFVAERRLAHFRAAFDTLYGAGRYDALLEFLDGLPAPEQDRPDYHEFRRRLDGLGHLRVAAAGHGGGAGGEIRIWVRGMVGADLEEQWRRLPADGGLSIGPYLVRMEASGMEPIVQAVTIERDAESVLSPRFLSTSRLPSGMVLVVPEGGLQPFAVDKTELTIGRYIDILRSVEDVELRSELRPRRWQEEGRIFMPVTGLSHAQARAAAALVGGHLMSEREYVLAATNGLAPLEYPWGRTFEIDRVVGDPRYTSELASSHSKPQGASPGGILHLVGNAAETLAMASDGRLSVAGGHFLSEPEMLSLRARQRVQNVMTQVPAAGMRLARFLVPPDDAAAQRSANQRITALLAGDQPCIVSRWTLAADGIVRLRQERIIDSSTPAVDIPHPEGFAPLAPPSVAATDGRSLALERTPDGYRFAVDKDVASSRVVIEHELQPIAALHQVGDGYVLALPLSRGAPRTIDRLELPAGCAIDEVDPPPERLHAFDGRVVVTWRCDAGSATGHMPPHAILRLRRDGTLTNRLPTFRRARDLCQAFFASLERADPVKLAGLLAADFEALPQGWDRESLLRNLQWFDRFTGLRIDDVTAVGDIVTVEARVRWSSGRVAATLVEFDDWPLRLSLRRAPEGLSVVRLAPASSCDLGSLQGGRYSHAGLRVDVEPLLAAQPLRRATAMTDLQVDFLPRDDGPPEVELKLRGCSSPGDEAQGTARMLLLDGEPERERGERVAGSATDEVGRSGRSELLGTSEHWLFREADDTGWRRERWTFLNLGHRHLLLRAVARGRTREAANQCFHRREGWFRAVARALRVR